MFSRTRGWLAEVGGKLEASVASSGSKRADVRRVSCALLDGYLCCAAASRDCPHFGALFSDKKHLRLVEQLFGIAKSILTERQRSLLVSAIRELRWNSMTLTKLCDKMSRELKMSYSTVKWNMRQLRGMKLLLGGTEKSKGMAARPTTLGLLIASMLIQVDNNRLCNIQREPRSY